jgi:outer membrane protein OmpA-like peptidoglycan-associated protein
MEGKRASKAHTSGTANHLASSFTDLMASLMVIFILLFVATVNNATKARQKKQDTVIEQLLGALKSALAKGGLDSGGVRRDEKDPFAVVIVMPEELLFGRGDRSVQPDGQAFLAKMIPALSNLLCGSDLRTHVESIVVEGHTDTTWVGTAQGQSGPEMNLELSQQRSMDVVRTSLVALREPAERDCFRRMLSASGRGQEELLDGISGDDARQRRVVFKIRTRQDSIPGLVSGLAQSMPPPGPR